MLYFPSTSLIKMLYLLHLQGVQFNITTQLSMPYIGLTRNEMGEVHLQNGMFVDIFKELSKLLNFSYHAIEPPDGQWGAMKSDGKWSGMVGQLEEKVVDFGMPYQQF